MKNVKNVESCMFGSEEIICTAKQSSRLLFWAIRNLIIFVVVMGLPIGAFLLLPIIPAEWKEFANNNMYIYYIYAGIAGLWLLIYVIKLLVNISVLAKSQVFLTTKRVIILRRGQITTVLFSSINSVTMSSKVSKKATSIEIQTAPRIYKFAKMKNGSKLVDMLTDILLGGTIMITTEEKNKKKEETPVERKETKELRKEEQPNKTSTFIKPNLKVEDAPETYELDATDKLLKKSEDGKERNKFGRFVSSDKSTVNNGSNAVDKK